MCGEFVVKIFTTFMDLPGLTRLEDQRIARLAELFKRPSQVQIIDRWRIEREHALNVALEYQMALNKHPVPPAAPAPTSIPRLPPSIERCVNSGMCKGGLSYADALKRARIAYPNEVIEEYDDDDENEDEEEEEVAEPAPAPEPEVKKPKRAGKPRTEADKAAAKLRVEHQHAEYIRGLVALYNDPVNSLVEVTEAQYRAAVASMTPNLQSLSNTRVLKFRALMAGSFKPRALKMRLPVAGFKHSLKLEETVCPACNRNLEQLMVHNLTCTTARFHPVCAAVLVDAVGAETFYDCLACMNHFEPNSRRHLPKSGYQACRHTEWKTPEVTSQRAAALSLFTSKVD